jgi:hypothetical protein
MEKFRSLFSIRIVMTDILKINKGEFLSYDVTITRWY